MVIYLLETQMLLWVTCMLTKDQKLLVYDTKEHPIDARFSSKHFTCLVI